MAINSLDEAIQALQGIAKSATELSNYLRTQTDEKRPIRDVFTPGVYEFNQSVAPIFTFTAKPHIAPPPFMDSEHRAGQVYMLSQVQALRAGESICIPDRTAEEHGAEGKLAAIIHRLEDGSYLFQDVMIRLGPQGKQRGQIEDNRRQLKEAVRRLSKTGGHVSRWIERDPGNRYDENAMRFLFVADGGFLPASRTGIFLGYAARDIAALWVALMPDLGLEFVEGDFHTPFNVLAYQQKQGLGLRANVQLNLNKASELAKFQDITLDILFEEPEFLPPGGKS